MIFSFIQKERLPISRFEIQEGDCIRATALAPEFKTGFLSVDENNYELAFDGLRRICITRNGEPFAEIVPQFCQTKKVLFLPIGYDYYRFTVGENTYTVYEVGLGADKHFYCFYVGEETVAIIHKPDQVKNYLDRYDCYLASEDHFLAVGLFCLFLEAGQYYDIDCIGNKEDNTETITLQKELREKYDPSFISKVLTASNPTAKAEDSTKF